MLRDSYKFIVIKEGDVNLRQFYVSKLKIISYISLLLCIFGVGIYFSWGWLNKFAARNEISRVTYDNNTLKGHISDLEKQAEKLKVQIKDLQEQGDLIRNLLKLPQIDNDHRQVGVGGKIESHILNNYNYLVPIQGYSLGELHFDYDVINKLANLESISYREMEDRLDAAKDKYLRIPAIHPIPLDQKHFFSSDFGFRRDPFNRSKKHFHKGHDFSARTGTPVVATANGVVKKSKYFGSFGNYIEIDHGNGYVTAYGHLSRRHVKVGDRVIRGQKIGQVGNTGKSTAPHLHYEISYQKKHKDPTDFYFDLSEK